MCRLLGEDESNQTVTIRRRRVRRRKHLFGFIYCR